MLFYLQKTAAYVRNIRFNVVYEFYVYYKQLDLWIS